MPRLDEELDAEDANLFDAGQVRNYLQFIAGAVRRRRRLAASVFVGVVGLAAGALAVVPRMYHAEVKLLAQRSQVLAIRGDSPDATVAPTRGAAETVMKRDSLLAIIQTTDLLRHHRDHLAASQRALRWVVGAVASPPTEQEEIDDMVERLEKKLNVWTAESTVSIAIDWSDPSMAVQILEAAQRIFFDERHAQEITALTESIAIIRGHVTVLQSDIDSAVEAIQKLRVQPVAARTIGAPAQRFAPRIIPSAEPAQSARGAVEEGPDLMALKSLIEARKHAISELEEARQRQLSETQLKIVEQRTTFTENHPAVLDLQRTASALGTSTPQVLALRKQLASFQADLASKQLAQRERWQEDAPPKAKTPWGTGVGGVNVGGTNVGGVNMGGAGVGGVNMGGAGVGGMGERATPMPSSIDAMQLASDPREERNPMAVYARGQLRDAMEKYATLRAQVQAAQIDLETAQAAFKYRYRVLSPAQVPRKPTKPSVPLLSVLALLSGLLSAVVVVTIVELRAGRLVERWQLETLLGAPVLGQIELPLFPKEGTG